MSQNNDRALCIQQVVSDIYRQDAGPSYSVTRLSETLFEQGKQVHLHTLMPQPVHRPAVPTTFYRRAPFLKTLGISGSMRRELKAEAARSDIMHTHGLWMMPNLYAGWAARDSGCSLVLSPRGMLEPWARSWSKLRKDTFDMLLQRSVLHSVDCFHATSTMELDSIRRAGFTAPIAVIPIGIDVPRHVSIQQDRDERRILYLGRLHPKKNLNSLLTAWGSIEAEHPTWMLTIAGSGDNSYVTALRSQADILNLRNVEFCGEVFEVEKERAFADADLFVLPTLSENFGIVVAEALARALPVITTTGTPWNRVVEMGCGWWIDPDPESLVEALGEALSVGDGERAEMGARGREWMEQEFTWTAVGRATIELYEWLARGGKRPMFVSD